MNEPSSHKSLKIFVMIVECGKVITEAKKYLNYQGDKRLTWLITTNDKDLRGSPLIKVGGIL